MANQKVCPKCQFIMNEGSVPIRFFEQPVKDKRRAPREAEDKREGKAITAYRCPNCNYIELFRA